jgi:cyclopropane-fatty-acyl-phospholipid synthase
MAFSRTAPLRRELEAAFPERPFELAFWDGTRVPATDGDGVTFRVLSPEAVAHLLRAPGQLGLGRAYVSGVLDVDDLDAGLRIADRFRPPELDARAKLKLAAAAAQATGVIRPPHPPAAELRPRGRLHSLARDRRAVRHHYDLSNDFFALFLDRSMTYSCAFFSRDGSSLEAAQSAKLELTCTKLALQPGERVLDVGCGWGSFAIHAAREHGVSVVGITLSEPQAALARERVAEAGVADRVDIRVMDYREVPDEPFDAVASIGMVEHVGESMIDAYARTLARLLRPGGRLLNHGISRIGEGDTRGGEFSRRYVFPDGDTLRLPRVLTALERAGFEIDHVEGFREDYAETLTHWTRRLDEHLDEAARLVSPERLRVWRLYLRAAGNSFAKRLNSIYQVRCFTKSSA